MTVAAGQAAGWVEFPVADTPTLPAGDYWLGYWASGFGAVGFYETVTGGGWYTPAMYSATNSPPLSFGSSADAIQYSIDATLGPAGPPPPPPATITFGKTTVGAPTHTLGGNYLEVSGWYTWPRRRRWTS